MNFLWEILVPCMMNGKPVRTRHHREWDKVVEKHAGGLTILKPSKGKWVYQGGTVEERVIPVRIACDRATIEKIICFTLSHYKQIAVMAYKLSDEVIIKYAEK